MAKRQQQAKVNGTTRKPRSGALPGMEDHAITALEDVAHEYAEIRDQRIELNRQESALKSKAMNLMHRHEKTTYRHGGVEIKVIAGEEDIKVKVKKPGEDDDETASSDTDEGDQTLADA